MIMFEKCKMLVAPSFMFFLSVNPVAGAFQQLKQKPDRNDEWWDKYRVEFKVESTQQARNILLLVAANYPQIYISELNDEVIEPTPSVFLYTSPKASIETYQIGSRPKACVDDIKRIVTRTHYYRADFTREKINKALGEIKDITISSPTDLSSINFVQSRNTLGSFLEAMAGNIYVYEFWARDGSNASLNRIWQPRLLEDVRNANYKTHDGAEFPVRSLYAFQKVPLLGDKRKVAFSPPGLEKGLNAENHFIMWLNHEPRVESDSCFKQLAKVGAKVEVLSSSHGEYLVIGRRSLIDFAMKLNVASSDQRCFQAITTPDLKPIVLPVTDQFPLEEIQTQVLLPKNPDWKSEYRFFKPCFDLVKNDLDENAILILDDKSSSFGRGLAMVFQASKKQQTSLLEKKECSSWYGWFLEGIDLEKAIPFDENNPTKGIKED